MHQVDCQYPTIPLSVLAIGRLLLQPHTMDAVTSKWRCNRNGPWRTASHCPARRGTSACPPVCSRLLLDEDKATTTSTTLLHYALVQVQYCAALAFQGDMIRMGRPCGCGLVQLLLDWRLPSAWHHVPNQTTMPRADASLRFGPTPPVCGPSAEQLAHLCCGRWWPRLLLRVHTGLLRCWLVSSFPAF